MKIEELVKNCVIDEDSSNEIVKARAIYFFAKGVIRDLERAERKKMEMVKMRTIEMVKAKLIESIKTGEGIRVRATGMGSGSYHYWLTVDDKSYRIHCYGQGQGWCDQSDGCIVQDIEVLSWLLWKDRKNIISK